MGASRRCNRSKHFLLTDGAAAAVDSIRPREPLQLVPTVLYWRARCNWYLYCTVPGSPLQLVPTVLYRGAAATGSYCTVPGSRCNWYLLYCTGRGCN